MRVRVSALVVTVMLLVTASAEAQRGRVAPPGAPSPDPNLPTLPLGGYPVADLLAVAGVEPPSTMTALDWRLRANVRKDQEHRFRDPSWLVAQNMLSGLATIHVWREREGKFCRTQTLTLEIAPDASVIVPMNTTFYANGDTIWFEYWPAYTLAIEAATSFGVWSTFGTITQSSSSSEPHGWSQPIPESQVSCE